MIRIEKTDAEKAQEMQRVFEYCIYMMVSSFFRGAHCKSFHLETQLLLYYKEYGIKKVYRLEERVLRMINRQLLPLIPPEYLNCDAEIRLFRSGKEDVTIIGITVCGEQLYLCSKYEGAESKIKAAWIPKESHTAGELTITNGNFTHQLTSQVA